MKTLNLIRPAAITRLLFATTSELADEKARQVDCSSKFDKRRCLKQTN